MNLEKKDIVEFVGAAFGNVAMGAAIGSGLGIAIGTSA